MLASCWMLAALKGAWSDWHNDASGMDTYMHIWDGSKIWFMFSTSDNLPSVDGWLQDEEPIDAVFLQAGDDLYMHAGTPHAVLTTEDSITFGGHYYSNLHLHDTLYCITFEHYLRTVITNTQHMKALLLFFKALSAFVRDIGVAEFLPMSLPKSKEVCQLLVLVNHMDQLTPYLPSDAGEDIWQGTKEFNDDFKFVLTEVKKCAELMRTLGQQQTLFDLEEDYFTLLSHFNRALSKEDEDLWVDPKCLCGLQHKRKEIMEGVVGRG
ncbi:hypothetical protein M0805_001914 [Coniferiporia weirii]|nr:hypothetical protein M0805_001914 [Coniferiporia weirii]